MKTLVRVLFLSAALAGIFVLGKKQNYIRRVVRFFTPAVELGKQATFGLMGRPGYEKHLTAVEKTLGETGRVLRA